MGTLTWTNQPANRVLWDWDAAGSLKACEREGRSTGAAHLPGCGSALAVILYPNTWLLVGLDKWVGFQTAEMQLDQQVSKHSSVGTHPAGCCCKELVLHPTPPAAPSQGKRQRGICLM